MNAILRVCLVLGLLLAFGCAIAMMVRWWRGEALDWENSVVVQAEDANLRELWVHSGVNDSWCEIATRAHAYCWGYADWTEFRDIVSRHPRAHAEKDWQVALQKAAATYIGFIGPDATYRGPGCRHYQARRVWETKKKDPAEYCSNNGDNWEPLEE
jgi:hypothetical protein